MNIHVKVFKSEFDKYSSCIVHLIKKSSSAEHIYFLSSNNTICCDTKSSLGFLLDIVYLFNVTFGLVW